MEVQKKMKNNIFIKKIILYLLIIIINNGCKTIESDLKSENEVESIILKSNTNDESIILNKEKNNSFLKDFKKLKKTEKTLFIVCYEIEIEKANGEKNIYVTDGNFFLKDNIYYYYSNENLITKHWGILEENFCKQEKIKLKNR